MAFHGAPMPGDKEHKTQCRCIHVLGSYPFCHTWLEYSWGCPIHRSMVVPCHSIHRWSAISHTGRKNLQRLHSFGCCAVTALPYPARSKLQSRSNPSPNLEAVLHCSCRWHACYGLQLTCQYGISDDCAVMKVLVKQAHSSRAAVLGGIVRKLKDRR